MRVSLIQRAVLATLPYLAVHAGCSEVTGGAVEVSWDLRNANGSDLDCDAADVGKMRLFWRLEEEQSNDTFPCEDARGVTRFALDPGEVQLWLVPVCKPNVEATEGFRAPPPIVRTITEGEVITLTTQVVEVNVTNCTEEPCICQ